MELIQSVRNFFGEKVAFYIFWITSFNKWLLSISIIGLGVFILVFYSSTLNIQLISKANIDIISLVYLIFCVIVATWCKIII